MFEFAWFSVCILGRVLYGRCSARTSARAKSFFLLANLPLYFLNSGSFTFLGKASSNMHQAMELILHRTGVFGTQINVPLSIVQLLLGITLAFTIWLSAGGSNRARKGMLIQLPLAFGCNSLEVLEGYAHAYGPAMSFLARSLTLSFLATLIPYSLFIYYYAKSQAADDYFGMSANTSPVSDADAATPAR